jgi:antitoxin YefM
LSIGESMEAVVYSHARNNLRTLINKVCTDFTEFIISTKDNKSAVLISQEEYSAMKETLYLLSSRNNRERLLDAVDEIERGNFSKHELVE